MEKVWRSCVDSVWLSSPRDRTCLYKGLQCAAAGEDWAGARRWAHLCRLRQIPVFTVCGAALCEHRSAGGSLYALALPPGEGPGIAAPDLHRLVRDQDEEEQEAPRSWLFAPPWSGSEAT